MKWSFFSVQPNWWATHILMHLNKHSKQWGEIWFVKHMVGSSCSRAVTASRSHWPHLIFLQSGWIWCAIWLNASPFTDRKSLPVWSKLDRIMHSVHCGIPTSGLVLTDQRQPHRTTSRPPGWVGASFKHQQSSSHTQQHWWLWWRQ